ncbi:hypothetical protein [Alteraurantiacibacter buctensis]|uniref:Uncharacterized protein n=1 Tax=Alteraurantiacibacter buctensis TaxID=1503981 RepID=A0A844Z0H2_9SPHN|nr:hypothetical protein [Alteraurantiacibacter buctensis]MXO71877.1 hypothetical protein [Alteraurantiacibacter buctensis]
MTEPNKGKLPTVSGKASTKLVVLGSLDDVLGSQASPELKAACIAMALEGAQRTRQSDGPSAPSSNRTGAGSPEADND